jgi:hypothetical protein
MTHTLDVGGSGAASLDTAEEGPKAIFRQAGATQLATATGEPRPAGAAPGASWDDEEDWQRLFL